MALVGSISGSGGVSNTVGITGSLIVANPGLATFPEFPGTDSVFFVSGAIGGKTAGTRTVSVFGGDAVVSGSLTIGTGSVTITSNDITFQGGIAQILSGSGGLTFVDSSGTVTLTDIIAGSTIQPTYWQSNTAGEVFTTGSAVTSGSISVKNVSGNTVVSLSTAGVISGSSDVQAGGNLTVAGDAAINGGDITTTSSTATVFNTTATTLNVGGQATSVSIGSSSGLTTVNNSLTVKGDLYISGTVTTIDSTVTEIQDPVIGLGYASGSVALAAGDRGFIGGITGTGNNVAFVWSNSNTSFIATKTTSAPNTAVNTPVTISQLQPVRASEFDVGGNTTYISSSDGSNLLINHASTTTFTKTGTPVVEISDYAGSGEGQIKGVTTSNALSSLWLSGSAVNIGSPTVSFLINDIQQATIKPQTGGSGVRFEGQDGTGAPRAMVISGSQTTIGSNSRLVVLEGAGTTFLTASVNAGLNTVTVIGSPSMTTASVFNANSTTVNFAGAATTLAIGNTAGTNTVSGQTRFTQGLSGSLTKLTDGTSYLIAGSNITITTGSNGAVTVAAAGGGDVTGPGSSTDTAIARFNGITGKIIQNTAGVTIDGTNNVVTSGSFQTKDAGGNIVARISNGGEITGSNSLLSGDLAVNGGDITTNTSTFNLIDTTALTVNFARAATSLVAGASGGSTTFQGNLTGSNVQVNGGLTVTQGASIGGGFGSSGVTITGTGNISTDGTLLVVGATTLSGSVTLGDATGDDLTFNGYAASSLIPKTTNAYDLGSPALRWRNMYTGDLHLKNERGDWTVIEEEDYLTITNNKSGKRYKFVLEEI